MGWAGGRLEVTMNGGLKRITGDVLEEFIHRAMETVTSADKAYRWLKEQGAYAPRSEVRTVWKTVGEKEHWATVLETWGVERKPPRYWTVETGANLKEDYLYLFKVEVYDVETREYREEYWSRYVDKLMSYADMWDDMSDVVEEYEEVRGQYVIDWRPGGIVTR